MQGISWSDHLQQTFGLSEFRSEQKLALEKLLLDQKNVLLLLPTGGGKSLIYQFVASYFNELVVVISPLIALMDDQVHQAKKFGIQAGALHSGLAAEKKEKFLAQLSRDHLKLIFVTPERFGKTNFQNVIAGKKIRLLAVDEAHSLSQWGHDLRPDYKKLPQIQKQLGSPPTIAMTATATEQVRKDIAELLQIKHENWVIASFYRPELAFEVKTAFGFDEKMEIIFQKLVPGESTIIYSSLITTLEKIADQFERRGLHFTKYHGDLPAHIRRGQQKLFIEGEVPLMLATPAFGLGIHKSDVRRIIHFEIPANLESYFQEAGRAGRDRMPAAATLIYDEEDVAIQMDFIRTSHPRNDFIRYVLELVNELSPVSFELLKTKVGGKRRDFRLDTSLRLLMSMGLIEWKQKLYTTQTEAMDAVLAQGSLPASEDIETHEKLQMQKLLAMVKWASDDTECRYKIILNYFSEDFELRCGVCDNCLANSAGATEGGL